MSSIGSQATGKTSNSCRSVQKSSEHLRTLSEAFGSLLELSEVAGTFLVWWSREEENLTKKKLAAIG